MDCGIVVSLGATGLICEKQSNSGLRARYPQVHSPSSFRDAYGSDANAHMHFWVVSSPQANFPKD